MKNLIYSMIMILCISMYVSCDKSDFLSAKPEQSLVVPHTLDDFQALMDNEYIMTGTAGSGVEGLVPILGEAGSDNYYVTKDSYNTYFSPLYRNCYIWNKNIYTGDPVFSWSVPYRSIYYCNVALEGISKIHITKPQKAEYNNIKGSALFYRAHLFYQLAQIFAPPYDDNAADTQLGIPLRLTTDIYEKIKRSTLKKTYDRIISDLEKAEYLLPYQPKHKTRPCKIAVYGLLARVYQTMGEYKKALLYSDSCLQNQNTLIDYNTLDPLSTAPFQQFNQEVIFACNTLGLATVGFGSPISPYVVIVDSTLYQSYNENDLRRVIFFKDYKGYKRFYGSYSSFATDPFAGIAVDEMYLIRAECNARMNNINKAMDDLNTLLKTRWKTGTFIPFTANSPQEALKTILSERRKELLFRCLRWTDLRRLNKEGANITITREMDGQIYKLMPNDPRYTYPIPPDVINFHQEMEQNIR